MTMNMVTQAIDVVSQPDINLEEPSNLYQKEWNSLFCCQGYSQKLKSLAIKGDLKKYHFRSVCWKVFLACLPEDKSLWVETLELHRKQYDVLLDKFDTNPRIVDSLDVSLNNPLSQSQQSPWNQYFEDTELKMTIEQDVVRTFPEIEFFQKESIQKMMTSILFSYARKFPHILYKQGMHELLAPILFVLMYDVEAYLEYSTENKLDSDLHIMLNQNYVEHDAYFMFCQLMKVVEVWYTSNDYDHFKFSKLITAEPFIQKMDSFPVDSLEQKLRRIYEQFLKLHDKELYLRLEELEITPQIFGIRWLRLLFGREFSMPDLLVVWDALFADGDTLELVDFVFVGMLKSIRHILLAGDCTSCLSCLMRFPNVADVHYIINLALHLKDPDNYAQPNGSLFNPVTMKTVKDNKQSKTKNFSFKAPQIQRPNSFSVALRTNVDLSSMGSKSKTSRIVENPESALSADESESDNSFLEYCDKSDSYFQNKNSFPRTTISNVMENTNHDPASKIMNGENVSKSSIVDPSSREMVSLSRQSLGSPQKNKIISNKNVSTIEVLKEEISDMKLKMDYCAKQITLHLIKLQETMTSQNLLYNDEMCLAVAGLKKARDILKGNVSFSEETMKDDVDLYSSISEVSSSKRVSLDSSDSLSSKNISPAQEQVISDDEQISKLSPLSKKNNESNPRETNSPSNLSTIAQEEEIAVMKSSSDCT